MIHERCGMQYAVTFYVKALILLKRSSVFGRVDSTQETNETPTPSPQNESSSQNKPGSDLDR